MEDNIRKKMSVCECLGHFAVQQQMAQYCVSTILQCLKIIKQKKNWGLWQMAPVSKSSQF